MKHFMGLPEACSLNLSEEEHVAVLWASRLGKQLDAMIACSSTKPDTPCCHQSGLCRNIEIGGAAVVLIL